MSNPNRPPQQSYGCPNPACDYYLKRRTVSLTHLGQGLYGRPVQVVCECGTAVLPVMVTPIPYTIPEPEGSGSVPPRPRATRSPGADQPPVLDFDAEDMDAETTRYVEAVEAWATIRRAEKTKGDE